MTCNNHSKKEITLLRRIARSMRKTSLMKKVSMTTLQVTAKKEAQLSKRHTSMIKTRSRRNWSVFDASCKRAPPFSLFIYCARLLVMCMMASISTRKVCIESKIWWLLTEKQESFSCQFTKVTPIHSLCTTSTTSVTLSLALHLEIMRTLQRSTSWIDCSRELAHF